MAVQVRREGSEYVAFDEQVLEMGFGTTEAKARANLADNTIDLHQRLFELGPDRLGPHLARVLEVLNRRAMMAETTQETVDRLAKVIRNEASELEARHREQHGGSLRDSRPADQDYQKGKMDGLRLAGDLLDEGKGR